MLEADDDVGHLDAGVVEVVLDLDALAEPAEDVDEDVAEDGVPEVPDVGGLVRVDVRVLDDDLPGGALDRGRGDEHRGEGLRAVEEEVHVAAPFDAPAGDDRRQDERRGELLGDLPRGAAEDLRQLEGDRQGEVAELDLRGGLDDETRGLDAPEAAAGFLDGGFDFSLQARDHGYLARKRSGGRARENPRTTLDFRTVPPAAKIAPWKRPSAARSS